MKFCNMPPILYKYRALSDRTESIITTNSIWLAKPSTLNDPLECKIEEIDEKTLRAKSREMKLYQLLGFMHQLDDARKNKGSFFNLRGKHINRLSKQLSRAGSFEQKHKIANEFLLNIGTPGFSRTDSYRESIEWQMSNIGVFSLSEDPVNMLMWSHYASNHDGIAIGFGTGATTALGNPSWCKPVIYSDEPNEFDFRKGFIGGVAYHASESGKVSASSYISIDDQQIQQALFRKTNAWSYEKEWRYLRMSSGIHKLDAPIVELIFGLNCNLAERRSYVALAKKAGHAACSFKEVYKPKGSTSLALRDVCV